VQRLKFDRFIESDIVHLRLVYMAKQENSLGIRERIEKELAVMIDDLMMTNQKYESIGQQLLPIWQGYMMALSTMDVVEE
jgi:hypothetical protein